jgi:predicted phosphoribosyltransferase
MQIAIRALRRLKPARIISAVPVASRDGHALIEQIADETVALAQPEPFAMRGCGTKISAGLRTRN